MSNILFINQNNCNHTKSRKLIKISILILLFISFNNLNLLASKQLRTGATLDRIIAIVGSEIIMQSDLKSQLMIMAQQDPSLDIEDEELRNRLLDEMINRKILITKAEEDTISISDELIEERWKIYKQELLNYYGSIENIEKVYKKSLNRFKLEARSEIKKMLMAQQLEAKHLNTMNINVTGKDVEEFYNTYKDSLAMTPVPEQIELYHIVRYVHPDTTSKKNTYNTAKKVRDSIVSGKYTFADAAKKYSADAMSGKDGGNLGWFGKGKLVPEFEEAAYKLQKDEISLPVESPFGFHVIQLIEKASDSINVRHILFKLEQSKTDLDKVQNFLDSIKTIANAENFLALAKEHSEETKTKGFGGSMGKNSINSYPPTIAEVIKNLQDGEISTPEPYQIDPLKSGMHLIFRKKTFPAHTPNIEQDYELIKKYTQEYKRMQLRKEWIKQLRKEVYWEIVD